MLPAEIRKLVVDLLDNTDNPDSPLIAAQSLYNETWLIRLAFGLHFQGLPCLPVQSSESAKWFSEPYLYSPFLAKEGRDVLAERHTHADAVLGHVEIATGTKRGLRLRTGATQFAVFEAKMFSSLSGRTQNAAGYDQATRIIACMAHMLSRPPVRKVAEFSSLQFFVVCPNCCVERHRPFLDRRRLHETLNARLSKYVGEVRARLDAWKTDYFDPLVESIHLDVISWESVIEQVKTHSLVVGGDFDRFYQKCLAVGAKNSFIGNNTSNGTDMLKGDSMLQGGDRVLYNETPVYVVIARGNDRNCRVVPITPEGDYFPRSFTLDRRLPLSPYEGPFDHKWLRPNTGLLYTWDPVPGEEPRPRGKAAVPASPAMVRIGVSGVETSEVILVNDQRVDTSMRFHVYNHHLKRSWHPAVRF